MAAALLSKDENTVLNFAGFFLYDLHMETAEDIASRVYMYHCFRAMPTPTWFCGKDHCLTGTEMRVGGPKVFALLLHQISIHDMNVKMLVEILHKNYQITKAMDADASSTHNRNVSMVLIEYVTYMYVAVPAQFFCLTLRRRLFHFCLIVCTSPKYFVVYFVLQLNSAAMVFILITFKPYNLNSIPITNVSSQKLQCTDIFVHITV